MKDREDIGSLFEKKLKNIDKMPKEALWDKISTTLDAEEKKKRRFLLFWLTGGGIALLLVLLLGIKTIANPSFLRNDSTSETNTTEKNTIEKNETSKETLSISETQEVSEEPLKLPVTNNGEPSEVTENSKVISSEEKTEAYNTIHELSKKSVSETKALKSQSSKKKESTFDENYTINKNYHYYNSETDQTITTNNKKTIDSILNTNNQQDTLTINPQPKPFPIKKTDSF